MEKELTLGPILFNWPAETWRDFYFRIADEAPVNTVYIGEVVCSKRTPFIEPYYEEVAKRLTDAGKTAVFSTLAEVVSKRDRQLSEALCALEDYPVEINDVSGLWFMDSKPCRIGPFVNVYNEQTLDVLARHNVTHICLPPEIPAETIECLGAKAKALGITLEVQVYGRIPLALSARCYHARAHGKTKDSCQYVCEESPDGMDLRTLEEQPFLAINGIQTLSYTCLNLAHEMAAMSKTGINAFRLSPHSHDMVDVARTYRSILDGTMDADEGTAYLSDNGLGVPFSNGFYYKSEGHQWIDKRA